jgi:hypothetical protein
MAGQKQRSHRVKGATLFFLLATTIGQQERRDVTPEHQEEARNH